VFLTAEMEAPVATTARLDIDLCSIVEHTRTLAPRPHHQCVSCDRAGKEARSR
jgi:hypothetical protein